MFLNFMKIISCELFYFLYLTLVFIFYINTFYIHK